MRSLFATADSIGMFARAGGLLSGPVAKSGARSHPEWRASLARSFILSGTLYAVSAAKYASIAVKGA